MSSSTSSPTSIVVDRLHAVKELAEALAAKYPNGGFYLHESLQFSSSAGASNSVSARVIQPVQKGTPLLIIPAGERINYENIVAFRGKETLLTTTSKDGDTTISLAKILNRIEEGYQQKMETAEAKDVILMALVMFMLAQQKSTSAPQPDHGCFHFMPATWPYPADVAAQFEWTDEEAQGLKGTYAAYLLTIGSEAKQQIFQKVILPILEEAHVMHHFAAPSSCPTETDGDLKKVLQDTFRYAFHIAQSRCHDSLPGERSSDIMPLIDLFDGFPGDSTKVNVYLECDPWVGVSKNIHGLSPEQNQCHPMMICQAIYAKRDLNADEQLFISYGDIAPSPFLYKYGVIPDQYLTEPHLPVDVIHLGFPVDMAPPAEDKLRIKALQSHGYPTNPFQMEEEFWFTMGPAELEPWRKSLGGGLGIETPPYELWEPTMLKNLRQYIMVALLATDENIQEFLKTKRIQGSYQLQEIGRFLLQVIDYNLDNLANSHITNKAELESLNNDENHGTNHHGRTALMARILYRDALAQWRHAICRFFHIFSAADDSKKLREFLNWDDLSILPHPIALKGGGCSVCGSTLHIQTCSRCRQVWYCSKGHQKSAWKTHKPLCMPVDVNDEK